jgi:hypothetical protein
MFTTFHDRTTSTISSIVKEPIVVIWAVIAIAGIALVSIGAAHPSGSEAAVARAMSAAKPASHSGN